jgi:MFS family permease
MRMVMLQNIAMGVFFMGSYIVTMPLLVREVFDGSAADLAWMNAANGLGVVLTIVAMLRRGDVVRKGRALLFAQYVGVLVLAFGGLMPTFAWFVAMVFIWGVCACLPGADDFSSQHGRGGDIREDIFQSVEQPGKSCGGVIFERNR